ncbi:MAG: geranylgeranylglyceryl/heptaprenylglyceryl phosphate synthase [Sulfolobales archaeon]
MKVKWRGKVSEYLDSKVRAGELVHLSLIDPAKVYDLKSLSEVARKLSDAGTDAFLVGGSIGVSESDVDAVVTTLGEVNKPVILFPGNVNGLSRMADAVLFMSLLNSDDPYYIIGAQIIGAPIIKKYGLEPLPTAYIVVGYGGTAGFIGKARPLPIEKPEIGVAYALAAEFLGMRYIYLEAGSGSPEPITPQYVRYVRSNTSKSYLIVGGGIRKSEDITKIADAGAHIIVTGNIIERDLTRAEELIKTVKQIRY